MAVSPSRDRAARSRELNRMSKRELAALCVSGVRAPDGVLVTVEGAYPVAQWLKQEIVTKILEIEQPPARQ
jgi:hypothetical protein